MIYSAPVPAVLWRYLQSGWRRVALTGLAALASVVLLARYGTVREVVAAAGTAGATIAAVVAAVIAGRAARGAAEIAREDRRAANDRAELERRHANFRERLDNLVSVAEALEAYRSTQQAMPESDAARDRQLKAAEAILRARVMASEDRPLAVEAVYDAGRVTLA